MENFTPGVVAKYGLSYEALRALNPRLIMCSISGFGQNGPDAHKPGNDLIAQAAGGLLNLVGNPDGPPLYPGVNIGDCTGGLSAFAAVTAALLYRERTGIGQFIDISLVECLAYLNSLGMVATSLTQGAYKQTRSGGHSTGLAPFGIFKATGGYVAISVLGYQWGVFANAIGKPELADDPRFNTPQRRMENQRAVIEIVESWLQSFANREEPLAILERAHILSTPVADTADVINREQTKVRGFIQEVAHPGAGPVGIPKTPFHFSQTPPSIPRRAPMLGEHNAAVLSETLGFSDSRDRGADCGRNTGRGTARGGTSRQRRNRLVRVEYWNNVHRQLGIATVSCTLTRASRLLRKKRNSRAACRLPQLSGRGVGRKRSEKREMRNEK